MPLTLSVGQFESLAQGRKAPRVQPLPVRLRFLHHARRRGEEDKPRDAVRVTARKP